MDATFERLKALDGKDVRVALMRAVALTGRPVYRDGTFRLFDRPNATDNPVTRIVDADGLALVTFRGADMLTVAADALQVALRPTFRIEVYAQPWEPPANERVTADFDGVARALTAELEAGFRNALLVRPDPDPDASARAQRGLPPVESGPLLDRSVRFAVGHAAATLRPDGDDAVRLTCVGSSVRNGRQFADVFEPAAGPRFRFDAADVARLAGDIRAFLCNRRERFTAFSESRAAQG